MSEERNEVQRYWREVDELAPKPGRRLAYVTFNTHSESFLLRAVEGAPRDCMSFRGIATDFSRTRPLNFHVQGPFIDLLEDLPWSPYTGETEMEFLNFRFDSKATFSARSAKVIWTKLPSERDLDPDGGLVRFEMMRGAEPITLQMTGIKRGWCPAATVAIVAIVAITVIAVTSNNPNTTVSGTVKSGGTEVSGTLTTGQGPATGGKQPGTGGSQQLPGKQ